jgi:hypothetical protein
LLQKSKTQKYLLFFNQACIDLCANIIFGKLSFSQRSSSRINRKFEIVFKIKLLNKLKSFKSLWIFNQHMENKSKNFTPKFDKILGCYNLLLVQIKVTVHYIAITSKIVDPSENILWLHIFSGTESHQRFSRQILLFHSGN